MSKTEQQYTINQLAEQTGHDRRSLTRWLKGVSPSGVKDGFPTYPLTDVEAAIEKHQRSKRKTATARERLIEVQTQKLLYQLSILRGEYVKARDVEIWSADCAGQIRRTLYAMPATLAHQVAGLQPFEVEQVIKDTIDNALGTLHKMPGTGELRCLSCGKDFYKEKDEQPN